MSGNGKGQYHDALLVRDFPEESSRTTIGEDTEAS